MNRQDAERPIMGLPRRFWAKVRVEDTGYETPCLTWTAYTLDGYSRFKFGPKVGYGHRIAYEVLVGPIPAGLVIDHLCRNRSCVNVAHMEPVTNGENILRGDTVFARNRDRTHCIQGHEFTPDNTVIEWKPTRRRACIACREERNAFYNAMRRAERATRAPRPKPATCKRGHPWTEETTISHGNGWRTCRVCRRALQREQRRKKRQQEDARNQATTKETP